LLRVEDVRSAYYGGATALWGVSLEVGREVVVVAGSNGAGKSTLLKTISGLIRPISGTIEFNRERIDGLPAHEIVHRGISLVSEGARVFPYMTVQDNLKLGSYRKEADRKQDETIKWVFQVFPILKEKRGQIAGTLSGGERQMLVIARGLMSCPQLIMLDEPSAGLAPKAVQGLFDAIGKEICQEGIMVLLVEQNLRAALRIAHRVYIMENGSIILEGDAESIQENEHVKKAYLGL